jgi:hypothetical protein
MIGVALVVIIAIVLFIWLYFELKKFKHKIWAMLIIAAILFGYFSFSVTLKGQDINYASIDGIMEAGGIYFSWIGGIFGNLKSITGGAVQMDWTSPDTNSSRSK